MIITSNDNSNSANNEGSKENREKIKLIRLSLENMDESQKMKLWIKTLISSSNVTPEIIKAVDKTIELQASSISFVSDIYNTEKSTFSQVEKVIDLTERKSMLLNLYIISKELVACLDDKDKTFIEKKFIFNWSAEELAIEYGISIRTVYRKLDKIIDQIYNVAKSKNWSLRFIELQVKGERWLKDRYLKQVYEFAKSNGSFSEKE